jgi:hypothetical protein
MNHKLMNEYLKMMDEKLVPRIVCGNDRDHSRPFVKFDDEYNNWCLSCPACEWKMRPGIGMRDEMLQVMALHDISWLAYEENSERNRV